MRRKVSYLQNSHLPRRRPSPLPIAAAYYYRLSLPFITITYRHHQWAIARIGRQQR